MELGNNKEKKINYILIIASVAYIIFLLALTLLTREVGAAYQYKTELFWSYREYFATGNDRLGIQMIGNVVVFIPWGVILPLTFKRMKFKESISSAFLFSVGIELVQLLLKCGLFEFDDVFHNTLGAGIGYGLYVFVRRWARKTL